MNQYFSSILYFSKFHWVELRQKKITIIYFLPTLISICLSYIISGVKPNNAIIITSNFSSMMSTQQNTDVKCIILLQSAFLNDTETANNGGNLVDFVENESNKLSNYSRYPLVAVKCSVSGGWISFFNVYNWLVIQGDNRLQLVDTACKRFTCNTFCSLKRGSNKRKSNEKRNDQRISCSECNINKYEGQFILILVPAISRLYQVLCKPLLAWDMIVCQCVCMCV